MTKTNFLTHSLFACKPRPVDAIQQNMNTIVKNGVYKRGERLVRVKSFNEDTGLVLFEYVGDPPPLSTGHGSCLPDDLTPVTDNATPSR